MVRPSQKCIQYRKSILSAKIVVKNTGSINDTFFSLLSHAEELIDAGRVREARRLIAQFIGRKHLDVAMLPALAALYLRVGKPDQAVVTMRQAIEQLGGQAELHNTFGLLLASLGREAESREQFEEALRIDPVNSEALRNLAFTLHRAGERDHAYAMLIRCYHAAPLSAELRLVCGALLEMDGKLDDAACCYRDVMELSQVCDQVNLASQRLFAIGVERAARSFEDVMLELGG
jgi:tetratricopeptide (TPR) repeat protein